MSKQNYIYSKDDFERAIINALEDMFGYELNEIIKDKVIKYLDEYINLIRFYNRNCAGCVSGNKECDFAYGRNKAVGCWEKAKNGELFDCPVRTNGTFMFSKEKGLNKIDISDRNDDKYPVIKK